MLSVDFILHLILNYVMPYGICMFSFFSLMKFLETKYRRSDLDAAWKKTIRIALMIGALGIVISWLKDELFPFIKAQPWWAYADVFGKALHELFNRFSNNPVIQAKIGWLGHYLSALLHTWIPIYWNTFVIVYTIGAVIECVALMWRVSFARTANVLLPAFFKFPFLIFQYMSGRQTPVYDFILAGKLKAKMRENLNDAYDYAIQGRDEQGNKFENGAGGSTRTQTIEAVAIGFKQAKVTVRTTMNGIRKARMFVRQTRETETDTAIENSLKGFGERVSGDSVYFPSDPIYSPQDKGFVFDSSVPYDSG